MQLSRLNLNNPMEGVEEGSNPDTERDTAIGLVDQQKPMNPMEPSEPSEPANNGIEDPWLDTDQSIYIDNLAEVTTPNVPETPPLTVPRRSDSPKTTATTASTKPKEAKQRTFKLQDKVKITRDSKYKGKNGVIIEVPSKGRLINPQKYRISFVVNGAKRSAWFFGRDFEALPEPIDGF